MTTVQGGRAPKVAHTGKERRDRRYVLSCAFCSHCVCGRHTDGDALCLPRLPRHVGLRCGHEYTCENVRLPVKRFWGLLSARATVPQKSIFLSCLSCLSKCLSSICLVAAGFLQDFLSRSRMFWRKTLAGKGTGAAAAKLRGAELTTGAVAVAAAVAKSSSDGGSAQVEITDKAAAVMVSPGFEGLMAGVEDNMYPPESKVISSATIISAAAAASAATTSTQAVTGAVTAVTSEFTEFGAPGPAAVPQPGPPAAPPVAIGAAATQAVGAPPAVTDAVEENEVIGDAGPRIQTNPGSSQ